ncbi:DUF262 domain-containing protein [Haloarcula sp. 1CSR25-25]|uniref:DUF262 domain-containing protein n=1 Tax=Haloarcula sp. 1CSR25-25 TaxID=2862545 RepID=UPI0028960110|nr:DUF262 domain-containing protein [Haloarcula sp. 1CSR25-25]MDT3434664.1 DUF262 domain-containing protein [Haloarcula sp. 1CSR25-25]
MSGDQPTPFDTLIDYEHSEDLGIQAVGDHQVMNQITELNFDIDKKPIGDLLTSWKFNVPEYQRLFSWQKKQHRQIWSELQEFIDSDLVTGQDNVSDVFFGSMYFAVTDEGSTLEVIDGQQRLTSVYILLRVILEKLEDLIDSGNIEANQVETLCHNSKSQIEEILYRWDALQGQKATLQLNKHDNEFFDALIIGDKARLMYLTSDDREYIDGRRGEATQISSLINTLDIDQKLVEQFDIDDNRLDQYIPIYDSNENLIEAYTFYKRKVQQLSSESTPADNQAIALINLNNYIQRSYYIGRFEIREAEPDFRMRIFEILNDRGLELTKIDRIRANVVNAFFDEDDRDVYIGKWEDIVVAFGTDSSKIEDYLAVYLSIIEEEVTSTGEAGSELINAFSTRNLESDVNPRFKNLSKARTFLDKAKELISYYQDITNPKLDSNELDISQEYRERCQEVLVRLDDLGTSQWYPLILAAYHYSVTEPAGDEEKFYQLLETTEKLNFRRLILDANPNVFENIFVEGAHRFYESVDTDGVDPYRKTREFMVNRVQTNASQMFSDGFIDVMTQAHSWNSTYAKLLFGKASNQKFREQVGGVNRELDMSQIHLEHILPQNFIHDIDDPIWPLEFFKTATEETEIAKEVEEYIKLAQQDSNQLDEEKKQRKEEIETFVTQRFVEDVGNFLLLRDRNNISASDRPLAEKLVEYYSNPDDFRDIHVNRYFTSANDGFDDDKLQQLLAQAAEVQQRTLDEIDEELTTYFNGFWNYENMKERRVDILEDLLDVLSFEEIDDEFGLESDRTSVRAEIREQTDREFEKRLSMRSL